MSFASYVKSNKRYANKGFVKKKQTASGTTEQTKEKEDKDDTNSSTVNNKQEEEKKAQAAVTPKTATAGAVDDHDKVVKLQIPKGSIITVSRTKTKFRPQLGTIQSTRNITGLTESITEENVMREELIEEGEEEDEDEKEEISKTEQSVSSSSNDVGTAAEGSIKASNGISTDTTKNSDGVIATDNKKLPVQNKKKKSTDTWGGWTKKNNTKAAGKSNDIFGKKNVDDDFEDSLYQKDVMTISSIDMDSLNAVSPMTTIGASTNNTSSTATSSASTSGSTTTASKVTNKTSSSGFSAQATKGGKNKKSSAFAAWAKKR